MRGVPSMNIVTRAVAERDLKAPGVVGAACSRPAAAHAGDQLAPAVADQAHVDDRGRLAATARRASTRAAPARRGVPACVAVTSRRRRARRWPSAWWRVGGAAAAADEQPDDQQHDDNADHGDRREVAARRRRAGPRAGRGCGCAAGSRRSARASPRSGARGEAVLLDQRLAVESERLRVGAQEALRRTSGPAAGPTLRSRAPAGTSPGSWSVASISETSMRARIRASRSVAPISGISAERLVADGRRRTPRRVDSERARARRGRSASVISTWRGLEPS